MFDVLHRHISAGLSLLLAAGLVILSFCLCAGVLLNSRRDAQAFTAREQQGIAYADALWNYMVSDNPEYLKGHAADDRAFGRSGHLKDIALPENGPARQRALVALIGGIGSSANLSREPDPAVAALMDIQIRQIPALWADASALEAVLHQPPSDARTIAYNQAKAQLNARLSDFGDGYARFSGANPDAGMWAPLAPVPQQIARRGSALVKAADDAVYHHRAGFVPVWDGWQQALMQAWPAQQAALMDALSRRTGARTETSQLRLALLLLITLMVLGLLVVAGMGMRTRMKRLNASLAQLAGGARNVDVPYLTVRGPCGDMARALAALQQTLTERESGAARQVTQWASALEAQTAREQQAIAAVDAGLCGLADDVADVRLAPLPEAYAALQKSFDAAVARFADMRAAQKADHLRAEAERKIAEETARQQSAEQMAAQLTSSLGAGLHALAGRDLSFSLEAPIPGHLTGLQRDFNTALHQLAETMSDMDVEAGNIFDDCLGIGHADSEMARRADMQAAALRQTSARLDELSARAGASASGAEAVRTRVQAALNDVAEGGVVTGRAIETLRAMAAASSEISRLLDAMDDMAFQASLLALNAGVDSRAGDDGHGAAAGAGDVRALARRTSDAALDMRRLMKTGMAQLDQAMSVTGENSRVLQRISEDVSALSEGMAALIRAQQDEAESLRLIGIYVRDMDRLAQENAAVREQSRQASESLAGHARNVAARVATYRL